MVAGAQDDAAELRKELDALRGDYEKRISRLESRIRELEANPPAAVTNSGSTATDSEVAAAKMREAEAQARELELKRSVDANFRSDTETREIALSTGAPSLLTERVEEVLGGYLDITGYFRSGYGVADGGGPMRAFGAPGVAKYRLGE